MVLLFVMFFMEINAIKKSILFICYYLLFFLNCFIYADNFNGNLVLLDISIEAENDLELIKYHKNWVQEDYLNNNKQDYIYNENFQEFPLLNNSDVNHKFRLGVAYQYASDAPSSKVFTINNVMEQHKYSMLELLYNIKVTLLYIEIEFSAYEIKIIRVYDLSNVTYTTKYNEHEKQLYDFNFKGKSQFTTRITNRFLNYERPYYNIEMYWIKDIFFYRSGVSIISVLEQKGSLNNDLFDIRKENENTWEIIFTESFVEKYYSNLGYKVELVMWGAEIEGFYINYNQRLSPYQFIFFTNRQLQVARNAYYARHGYIFKNQNLRRMYENDPPGYGYLNYIPNPNFYEDMLTETDKANIEIIKNIERLTDN